MLKYSFKTQSLLSLIIDSHGKNKQMKTYVENNQTVFICPHCNKEQYIDVANFNKKTLNIKCVCKEITIINLEYRQYFRKNISIIGKLQTKDFNTDIIILDLSIQGLKFKFAIKYKQINLDEIITVIFTLNEKNIIKRCKVKNKYDDYVGVQFMDDNFSRNIGFFLM